MAHHIAILCDSFPPDIRSVAILTHQVALGLRERGWEVSVVTTRADSHDRGVPGVRVIRVPSLRLHDVPAWRKGLAWLALPGLVASWAAWSLPKPDVVWVYSPPLTLGLAGAALKRRFDCRLVLNVQDLFPDNAMDIGVLRHPGAIRFWRAIEHVCYRAADRVVVHSRGHVPWLRRHAAFASRPQSIEVVHNFVDVEAVQATPASRDLKRRLGWEGRFVVLFGGVMGFAQDLETVVEAARVLRNRPDIAFLLVGDGVTRGAAERRAEGLSNVAFHDWVAPDVFGSWMKACDAGLVSLRADMRTPVVPSKTLFYMAAGLPVVASVPRSSDAIDLVLEARCGVWVPAGDPVALARACAAMADDREATRRMGERGLLFCRDRFSREAMLERICSILSPLVRAAPSPSGERR